MDEAAAQPVEKVTRKKPRASPAGKWVYEQDFYAMNAVGLLGSLAAAHASSLLFRLFQA